MELMISGDLPAGVEMRAYSKRNISGGAAFEVARPASRHDIQRSKVATMVVIGCRLAAIYASARGCWLHVATADRCMYGSAYNGTNLRNRASAIAGAVAAVAISNAVDVATT